MIIENEINTDKLGSVGEIEQPKQPAIAGVGADSMQCTVEQICLTINIC